MQRIVQRFHQEEKSKFKKLKQSPESLSGPPAANSSRMMAID
jgi:hypothetical protein